MCLSEAIRDMGRIAIDSNATGVWSGDLSPKFRTDITFKLYGLFLQP